MATYPTLPPGNTLVAIQQKVRRLTRSPSENQLTTDDLNNYINTFVVYDFPEHLRMFNLRTTFNFWCNPFQDVYNLDAASYVGVTTNPLYNFDNLYITVHPPVYIAGFQSFYSQSPENFFAIYPETNSINTIGPVGDGVTTTFSGVIVNQSNATLNGAQQNGAACLVKGDVLFSSVDANGNGCTLVDIPLTDSTTGNPTIWGNLYDPNSSAYQAAKATPPTGSAPYTPGTPGGPFLNNYINYVTGAFTCTFTNAPATGVLINSQTLPQVCSLPQAFLYYDGQFTLRPVPDQPYQINFEVYARPTRLLQTTSVPALEEWWQYIALGSAIKIFQDRMDMDSVNLIIPEYKKQESLCLRKTIVQYTNERTATIYTEQVSYSSGSGWGWGSSGSSF